MNAEQKIVDYVLDTKFDDISNVAMETVRNMLRADIGTTIAGAHAPGCTEIVAYCRQMGGPGEATLFIHGGLVPAQHAALANAVMSRALDFCDAMAPGPHIGSSVIPVALACAELRGGCDGREFVTALAVGIELAARFNLTEAAYDGFDPTGICVPFGATAVACRLLGLDKRQTWNALGIVFNRCGGSFQSNIDGTLSVRLNQGWVAQDSLAAARVAQLGMTGPRNFLEGIYGYLHLFAKDLLTVEDIIGGLGSEDRMLQMMYKKYPSCGATQAATEIALAMRRDYGIDPSQVVSVELTLPPYAYKLVGNDFKIGDNPTVDGQFSAQYCVANALLRGSSRIRHFTPEAVCEPELGEYAKRVTVRSDASLDQRGHTAMQMIIRTADGREYARGLDIAPGYPGNPLTREDHERRFRDCIDFAAEWFDVARAERVYELIERIESVDDVRLVTALLGAPQGGAQASA
jgi:2-methylcitrate dehydratase PrpD